MQQQESVFFFKQARLLRLGLQLVEVAHSDLNDRDSIVERQSFARKRFLNAHV